MNVAPSLRLWFLVHAAIDLVAALALLFAPEALLGRLGWTYVDPASARLVGAALLAIGGQSFLMRDAGPAVYRAMLGLKVIWSLSACFALVAAIGAGAPSATWAFLCIFIMFAGVWIHYAIRLRQLERAPADEPEIE